MALKDWKPHARIKEDIYWKKGIEVLSVNKIEKGSYYHKKYKSNWLVTNTIVGELKFFKTKKSATTFAKKYMRLH